MGDFKNVPNPWAATSICGNAGESLPTEKYVNYAGKEKITISTEMFHGPDKIVQEVEGISGMITQAVIETQDKQIRAALIAFGWTPPQTIRNSKNE